LRPAGILTPLLLAHGVPRAPETGVGEISETSVVA
jgi:hypothetical protein